VSTTRAGARTCSRTPEHRELGVLTTLAGLRGAAAAEFPLLHGRGALNEWVERYASNPS